MKQPSERQLKLFRSYLRKVLTSEISDQIKEETLIDIFKYNFDSNLSLAEKVLFFKYDEIEIGDYKITNKKKATSTFEYFRDKNLPILLVTDNDSDGSQAQAAMYAAKDYADDFDNVSIEFAQNLNENKNVHGITVEVVEEWAKKTGINKDSEFLVMTADNGIQSKDEVELILKNFPKSKVLITDHHLPDDQMTPKESDRVVIYNPKYKPQGFLKENPHLNISGAATLCTLIKSIVENSPKANLRSKFLNTVLDGIFKGSNAMDFVKASLQDYPLKPHDVDLTATTRALLNINNSVKSFVNRDISSDVLDRLAKNNKDLDKDKIKDSVLKIKELNQYSKVLLSIYNDYKKLDDSERKIIDDATLNSIIQNRLADSEPSDINKKAINFNYIEQLRPFIFYSMNNPHKYAFTTRMAELMTDVFTKLKRVERDLIDESKKLDLMHVVKRDNASILYAKDTDVISDLKLGRKLLMKVYNEHNSGVMLFMTGEEPDSKEGHIITNGSGRSIEMPLQDFCEKMNELMPDIKFRAKGHDKAAGIFMESKKRLSQDKINMMADCANNVVEEYKKEQLSLDTDYDNEFYYVCDTTNIHEVLEFNTVIAGFLPNQKSIEPLLKINRSTRFINRDTGLPETVGTMLKSNSYGYKTIEINFKGDVVILGTEVIRKLAENNYKDYVKLTQMSGGALIAQSIVEREKVNPENIIVLESKFKDNKKELIESINKLEKNNHIIPLSRKELMDNELIKRNELYGKQEFAEFESMILSIMDRENLDMYGVLDTEGLGFGAAFCFNVGILGIKIKEGSGVEVPLSEYLEAKKSNKIKDLQKKYVDGNRINNIKVDGDKITVNREIEADMLAVLLKDKNTYIPETIATLTGISQDMINKHAKSTEFADNLLSDFIKDKKTMLIAHNAGYDVGVLMASNLSSFTNHFFTNNCMVVDSASMSKQYSVGYADMDITQIGNLQSALFFDNEHSDYRLSKFIESDEDFTFPSLRGDYILKRTGEDYYLIDKEKRVETKLPYSDEEMRDGTALYNKPMPVNRVKYSVQFLLNNMAIRNMLLDQIDKKIELVEPDEDLIKLGIQDDFIDFCTGYNFGGDFSKNLFNFLSYLKGEDVERYNNFKGKIFSDDEAASKYFNLTADEISKENLKVKKDIDKKIKKAEKEFDKAVKKKPENEDEYLIRLENSIKELEVELKRKMITFDGLECLGKNVNNFISKNKEIYSKYINNWEYQLLLSVHDPMKRVIAKNDLDKITYQTGLTEERVIKLHNEIYDYKKKIGIQKESFFIKELHNNLDERGDMTIEHVPVALSMIAKYYNRYSNSSEQATDVVLSSYRETLQALFRRFNDDMVCNTLAINSATKLQLDNVVSGKFGHNEYIQSAKNSPKLIIKNDYLQAGMNIVAEKSTNEVTLDDVNEIEEDLNLVISYNLLKNSKPKVLPITEYVDKYILARDLKYAGEVFYENNIYNCEDLEHIKISLEAEDLSEEHMNGVVEIYNYFKKQSKLNEMNSENLNNTLINLQDDFIEAYKRVYDKIGYFYVDNAKKETKDIMDSIYANLLSNTSRFKINPKTLTDDIADSIRDMSRKVISMVESMDNMKINPDVIDRLNNKLLEIPTINKSLSDLISISRNVRDRISDDDLDFNELDLIMPLNFLGTRKLDPIKELTNYNEILRIKLKSKVEADSISNKKELDIRPKSLQGK